MPVIIYPSLYLYCKIEALANVENIWINLLIPSDDHNLIMAINSFTVWHYFASRHAFHRITSSFQHDLIVHVHKTTTVHLCLNHSFQNATNTCCRQLWRSYTCFLETWQIPTISPYIDIYILTSTIINNSRSTIVLYAEILHISRVLSLKVCKKNKQTEKNGSVN